MKTLRQSLSIIPIVLMIHVVSLADAKPRIDSRLPNSLNHRGGLIWIQDSSACNGTVLNINIMIANPDDSLDSFGFYLSYDPAVLDFLSCTEGSLDPGWQAFGCNEPSPGEIRCGGFSFPETIPVNSVGSLIALSFQVNCSACQNNDESNLTFSNLSDDLTSYGHLDGLFTYSCTPSPTQTPGSSNIITIGNASGCLNDLVDVNLSISNPAIAVDSFGFYLEYCSDRLEFLTCSPGNLDPGWTLFGCNEPEIGQIRAAGFSHPGLIPAGSSGILAVLTFRVKCTACEQGAVCDQYFSLLTDDLAGWQNASGTFACACTPTPIPTPVTGDSIWLENFSGCTGETITADIWIDNPDTDLDSFGFYLDYCSNDALQFQSCQPGSLNPGWVMFECNEPEPGQIRSGGFVASGGIQKGAHGTIVRLTFLITCTECSNGQAFALPITQLTDDLQGWLIQNGSFTYACSTSTPTRTNTPTITATMTATSTPTITATHTPSRTPTDTPTPTATSTMSTPSTPTPSPVPPPVPASSPTSLILLMLLMGMLIAAQFRRS